MLQRKTFAVDCLRFFFRGVMNAHRKSKRGLEWAKLCEAQDSHYLICLICQFETGEPAVEKSRRFQLSVHSKSWAFCWVMSVRNGGKRELYVEILIETFLLRIFWTWSSFFKSEKSFPGVYWNCIKMQIDVKMRTSATQIAALNRRRQHRRRGKSAGSRRTRRMRRDDRRQNWFACVTPMSTLQIAANSEKRESAHATFKPNEKKNAPIWTPEAAAASVPCSPLFTDKRRCFPI